MYVCMGDQLSTIIFNITPEKIIRDSGLHLKGTIYYMGYQIFAYADSVVIKARQQHELKETISKLGKPTEVTTNCSMEKKKVTRKNSRRYICPTCLQ